MFGQTFDPHDLVIIGLLIILEGVLSIDNALVLGLLAKRLPKKLQSRALTYGLVGAFVFRVIAIATAAFLLEWRIVKLLGGGYLIYVAVKHFFFDEKSHHDEITLGPDGQPVLVDASKGREVPPEEAEAEIAARSAVAGAAVEATDARAPSEALPPVYQPPDRRRYAGFWSTVMVIELTDIAFAVDSILAAIALVGSPPVDHPAHLAHPKLWVVITGGMLGVILMRFAAVVFIKLLERFPRFETSAYLLVIVIGLKLVVDWAFNSKAHPHRIDFHDFRAPEFWAFWASMIVCFCVGFIPRRKSGHAPQASPAAGA
jgi:YkoY family integral membrane protein